MTGAYKDILGHQGHTGASRTYWDIKRHDVSTSSDPIDIHLQFLNFPKNVHTAMVKQYAGIMTQRRLDIKHYRSATIAAASSVQIQRKRERR